MCKFKIQQSIEQRYAIKFCVLLGKSGASTLEMIQKAYGRESLPQAQVFRWHKMLKEGRESGEDEPRPGHPNFRPLEAPPRQCAISHQLRGYRALDKNGIVTIPQSPYSPNLSPADFFLIPKGKTALKGCHHGTLDDVKRACTHALKDVSVGDFQGAYETWKPRLQKCVHAQGAYFEDYQSFVAISLINYFLWTYSHYLKYTPCTGLGPTFHGPRSAVGNPDLTLTSCDLVSFVENWEILSTESLSDHSFISVHLRCDLTFSDFVFKTKYGINKFIYNFRKNYNLLNSFLTNISSIELLDDFASLLINTTNASAFSTLRKRRVLNTPSFKWWNNSLRIQRNQLNAYKRRVVSLTTHGMSVDEIASMHSRYKALRANYKKSIIDTKNKAWEYFCSTNSNNFGFIFKAAFGKLSSPTNLHQISTGDPASLFHSKVSLLLDSHFLQDLLLFLLSSMTALLLHA
ncbi:HTH_48 domain-containing protein [Trichonephila clavipes]|nr:HTH_48 domain-containing protein [Trichonephila clavipes]